MFLIYCLAPATVCEQKIVILFTSVCSVFHTDTTNTKCVLQFLRTVQTCNCNSEGVTD